MNEKEKILAKNTFFLYLVQMSGYIFPLLTFPYLTRVLGREKYGFIVFANAVTMYFSTVLEFGFILSATKSCSEFRDNKTKLWNITFGVICAKLILAVLSCVVLFILCLAVENFRREKLFFSLSFAGIFLTVFLPDFLFRGIEKMGVLTYRVILSKVIYTVLIFLLVRTPESYCFVPFATIVANLVAVILTWIEIRRKSLIEKSTLSFQDVFMYLKDSSVFFLSRVAVSAYTTLNTVLLGMKFSPQQIGQYGAANNLISSCRSMLSPISDSIYPYMVKNRNLRLVKKIILILEPLIILGCILLYFIAAPVVNIVCGHGYEDAVPVMRAMLPLIVISLPTYLFGYPILGSLGKIKIANTSVIVGALFHILGLFVLYLCGILNFISVPILTFVTEIIVFVIRFFTVVKVIGTKTIIQ